MAATTLKPTSFGSLPFAIIKGTSENGYYDEATADFYVAGADLITDLAGAELHFLKINLVTFEVKVFPVLPFTGATVLTKRDGKIHLFFSTQHWMYDEAVGTYTQKNNVTAGATQAFVLNGDLYRATASILERWIPAGDTWEAKAAPPLTPLDRPGFVVGDKFYFVDGSDQVREYDPVADAWSAKAVAPVQLGTGLSSASIGVYNGKAYIAGGAETGVQSNHFYELDPAVPSVAHIAGPAGMTNRSNAVMERVGDVLYVIGGRTTGNGTTIHEALDLVTKTWSTKASPAHVSGGNNSITGVAGSAVANGKIYYGGGKITTVAQNVFEEYDPALNTWATKAGLPLAMSDFVMFEDGGFIYAFGTTSQNYKYDINANSWSTLPSSPSSVAKGNRYIKDLANNLVYVFSGTGNFYKYNTLTLEFTALKSLPVTTDELSNYAGYMDADGNLMSQFSNAWYKYNVAADEWEFPATSETPHFQYGRYGYFSLDAVSGKAYRMIGEMLELVEVWEYDPSGDSWQTTGQALPHYWHKLDRPFLAAKNGIVYVIGGNASMRTHKSNSESESQSHPQIMAIPLVEQFRSGNMVDENGSPLQGAVVRATAPWLNRVYETTTDVNGDYEINVPGEDPASAGEVDIYLRPPSGQAGAVRIRTGV